MYRHLLTVIAVCVTLSSSQGTEPTFANFNDRYPIRFERTIDTIRASERHARAQANIVFNLAPPVVSRSRISSELAALFETMVDEELQRAELSEHELFGIWRDRWLTVTTAHDQFQTQRIRVRLNQPEKAELLIGALCRAYDRLAYALTHNAETLPLYHELNRELAAAQLDYDRIVGRHERLVTRINKLAPLVYSDVEVGNADFKWLDHLNPSEIWALVASRAERTKALEVDLAGVEAEQALVHTLIEQRRRERGAVSAHLYEAQTRNDLQRIGIKAKYDLAKEQADQALALWQAVVEEQRGKGQLGVAKRELVRAESRKNAFREMTGEESIFSAHPPYRVNNQRAIMMAIRKVADD
jgi:hypothetical protein